MDTENPKPELKWDQRSLTTLKPGSETWTFNDPTTPGLALRVTPGTPRNPKGTKVYYFTYRMGGRGSRFQWLRLSAQEDLPLVRARELVRHYRTQRDQGIDPAIAIAEAANRGATVADVCTRFMEEYAPISLKAKSILDYACSIRVHIAPVLGKTPIQDLTREQVTSWHRGRIRKGGRGAVAANRALAILSSICTQAEIWGLRPEGSNPCRHVDRFPEAPRVRDVTQAEMQAVGLALQQLRSQSSEWMIAAIQVVVLCAGRISEVLNLRRDKGVDLDAGVAVIREHKASKKAGTKYLELPPAAVTILRNLGIVQGNPYYFPGRTPGKPITARGLQATWTTVCQLAGVEGLHIHDFRSFAASEGLAQGVDSKVTSRLLGHTDQRTTEKHYTKVRNRQAAEAAARISAPIAQAFGINEPPSRPNVRRLVRRGIRQINSQ